MPHNSPFSLKFLARVRNTVGLLLVFCLAGEGVVPVYAAKAAATPTLEFEENIQTPTPQAVLTATPADTATPVPTATRTMTPVPGVSKSEFQQVRKEVDELSDKMPDMKTRLAKQEEAAKDLSQALDSLKDKLDNLDKKLGSLREDWQTADAGNVKKMDLKNMEDLTRELKQSAEASQTKVNDFENEIKKDQDQLNGLNDMVTVLRKDSQDNALEVAGVKKDMEAIKNPAPAKSPEMTDMLNWPYWGVTAAGLAVVAIVLAVTVH